ncbi:MAG TPA: hypothetical protein VFH76_25495, partial [Kribbella sp.]|nr:hypothetical protein [Kribbella sp.]
RESLAGYTIDRAVDKGHKKPYEPFFYTLTATGAPTYGSYPMHFVTKSTTSTTKDYLQFGVWQRNSAGAPWLHTFTTWIPVATKTPDLTGLREITTTDKSKWTAAPGTVANELAAYLTAQVAAGKSMAVKQPKQYRSVSNTFTLADPPVTFATASGEALAFVTLNDEYKVEVGSGYRVSWTDPELAAFSPASDYYENALTNVSLHDIVLVIPPKGHGKVRILSLDSQLIDAGGY